MASLVRRQPSHRGRRPQPDLSRPGARPAGLTSEPHRPPPPSRGAAVPVRSDLLAGTNSPGPADRHLHLVPAPALDSEQAAADASTASITPIRGAVPVQGALA